MDPSVSLIADPSSKVTVSNVGILANAIVEIDFTLFGINTEAMRVL